ncbi:hypothetical protein UP10_26615 [Bradyrhizobium sp. LTSPM299]|nr:hypothetical protein UP10_26615 [Bradyrhizobium sp. LTSPM299]
MQRCKNAEALRCCQPTRAVLVPSGDLAEGLAARKERRGICWGMNSAVMPPRRRGIQYAAAIW